MSGDQHVLHEVRDRVAVITLNRPERLNALSPAMRLGLAELVEASGRDEGVRAIVITGAGRAFCSGGDVKAMQEARDRGEVSEITERMAPTRDRAVLAIRNAAKPVIAAVNGPAAGAGMSLALACDIRIGSQTAKMGQTFARRGLHPDWGGTYFLPRIVGTARACELIWSGRLIDAQEAHDLGILLELVAPEETLERALELAASFAESPPIAVRLAKRSIYKGLESGLKESLEHETFSQNICQATDDAREGIAAFVEKREPRFEGR